MGHYFLDRLVSFSWEQRVRVHVRTRGNLTLPGPPKGFPFSQKKSSDASYLKLLDFSQLFVADTPTNSYGIKIMPALRG